MWAQAINVLLGIWLMAAPTTLGYSGLAANSDHIVGPLVATFACIALWEVTRALRWLNLPLGLWQVVAPWLFDYPTAAAINGTIVGIAVAALTCIRGRLHHRFGGGWSALWKAAA